MRARAREKEGDTSFQSFLFTSFQFSFRKCTVARQLIIACALRNDAIITSVYTRVRLVCVWGLGGGRIVYLRGVKTQRNSSSSERGSEHERGVYGCFPIQSGFLTRALVHRPICQRARYTNEQTCASVSGFPPLQRRPCLLTVKRAHAREDARAVATVASDSARALHFRSAPTRAFNAAVFVTFAASWLA